MSDFAAIRTLLGAKADYLLQHQSQTIAKERLHLPRVPSADFAVFQ